MPEDIIDLILSLSKRATNTIIPRDDELLHILLETGDEAFTITEGTHIITKGVHPVKWGEAKWGQFTWG